MSTDAISSTPPRNPPKFLNNVMKFVLASPLHSIFSKSLLLLTFTGRKSGKSFTIPLGYRQDGNTIFLFTDHKWWKNLVGNAPVTLHLKGKQVSGTAEVIEDKEVTEKELQTFLLVNPNAARAYSVTMDAAGQPDPNQLRDAARRFMHIRIHLA
ncbi:hypothetical protein KDA_61260 [Dictyobacter alpinus]|uniref:Nitroreductase n=1 Tax=Dictyobacter alpinus TaxID=2014873 RepID=A0A402BHC4_9CHLR|nr:nitroreductase/quinone reductase family protein [Dictyobacter alpinus]GCE30642.1 hypothetical protein KDA_61260 [Dictyobacter alpinus]